MIKLLIVKFGKSAEIKSDLLKRTDGTTKEEWMKMPKSLQAKIELGIAQADAGKVKTLSEVRSRLRQKYGLNG